jgi:hypothetical protein
MSYIPIETLNMSLFSLDTGFNSTPGTQDPIFNPLIVEGLEVHSFFTAQTQMNGKYIDNITIDNNGIVLPQGYSYILDPYFYYSSGTAWKHAPHFIWVVDGVDQAFPRFSSQYAGDNIPSTTGDIANGRGYRGLKYIDCSLASKTVKIRAVGPWNLMGNVYWDNQQTNTALTSSHKSHILIYAIPSASIENQTPRTLDATQTLINGWNQSVDCIFPTTSAQLPADALNKYIVCTRTTASTSFTYNTPANPVVGDWLGFIVASNSNSTLFTLSCLSPTQTLVSNVSGYSQNTCYGFKWTGVRWVEVPFTSLTGLVKLPRA